MGITVSSEWASRSLPMAIAFSSPWASRSLPMAIAFSSPWHHVLLQERGDVNLLGSLCGTVVEMLATSVAVFWMAAAALTRSRAASIRART